MDLGQVVSMGHKEVVVFHEVDRILEQTVAYPLGTHGVVHPWADLRSHKCDVVLDRRILVEYNFLLGSHLGEGNYSDPRPMNKRYILAHSPVDIRVAYQLPWQHSRWNRSLTS